MNRVEIKKWAKDKIRGNIWNIWKGLIPAILVVVSINFMLTFVDMETTLGKIIDFIGTILIMPINIGIFAYLIKYVREDKLDNNILFCYYDNMWKIVLTQIIMGIVISLGLICFIIPGIYFGLSYLLVPYLIVEKPELSVVETLRLSRKMMKDRIFDALVLGFSFLGWALLAIPTFGIILIWLYPYMMITNTKFFTNIIDNYEEID